MLRIIIGICLVLLLSGDLPGQVLPRGLSPAEQEYIAAGFLQKSTAIPGALSADVLEQPPRSMAEWEELQAIAITWTGYRSILAEIVRYAVREVEVLIITSDEDVTRDYLANRDIDPDSNITYVIAPYNSVWIRDYGANPAYLNEVDSLILVDWIYNRPRPFDDVIPGIVADIMDLPLYATVDAPNDLVNTGGNFMSDGNGRGFSSKLVLHENGASNIWGSSVHSEEEVDDIMQAYMGIEDYVKMEVLPYDGIHHIDMHMKLLDETTLLVGQYPDNIADGPQIEANIQYVIDNFQLATGRKYTVHRIPMPPDHLGRYPHQGGDYRTYTNAMFINNTILVPTFEEKYDSTALRIWHDLMPGYTIAGIDCNSIISAGGAIHCIIKEVGVSEPLLIQHYSPKQLVVSDENASLTARVRHHSGISSVSLHYRLTDEKEYTEVEMQPGSQNTWHVAASEFPADVQVQYYFAARATNGKEQMRPIAAPLGYFTMETKGVASSVKLATPYVPEIHIFPNPASGITKIAVHTGSVDLLDVDLLDMHGRPALQLFRGVATDRLVPCTFNAASLSPGIYLVRARARGGQRTAILAVQ